jgi:hypothetical protein
MVKKKSLTVDLKNIFLGLQTEMTATLRSTRKNVRHPVAKGNVSESSWRTMLKTYLPERYEVADAFILDSDGNLSEQIDLVIFDRHFSPFLLRKDGACYIPAESVYAVFEIRQDASKKNVEYAAAKAESVRRLKRTSAHIPHAGGKYDPVTPKEIIAGLLSLTAGRKTNLSPEFIALVKNFPAQMRLNLGCVLECGSFNILPDKSGEPRVEIFPRKQALIQFFLSLLTALQTTGTVPAMDIQAYAASLVRARNRLQDAVQL